MVYQAHPLACPPPVFAAALDSARAPLSERLEASALLEQDDPVAQLRGGLEIQVVSKRSAVPAGPTPSFTC